VLPDLRVVRDHAPIALLERAVRRVRTPHPRVAAGEREFLRRIGRAHAGTGSHEIGDGRRLAPVPSELPLRNQHTHANAPPSRAFERAGDRTIAERLGLDIDRVAGACPFDQPQLRRERRTLGRRHRRIGRVRIAHDRVAAVLEPVRIVVIRDAVGRERLGMHPALGTRIGAVAPQTIDHPRVEPGERPRPIGRCLDPHDHARPPPCGGIEGVEDRPGVKHI